MKKKNNPVMKPEKTFPIITSQTGLNEAFLIGTREELECFANSILEALNSVKPDVFFGFPTETSDLVSGNLDGISEVKLDWLVVTKTSKEKQEMFYKIYNS